MHRWAEGRRIAGVVDPNVEPAEGPHGVLGQRLHLRQVADVARDPTGLAALGAQPRHGGFHRLDRARGQHNLGALRGRGVRNRQPQPAAAAGDDDDFAL